MYGYNRLRVAGASYAEDKSKQMLDILNAELITAVVIGKVNRKGEKKITVK